MIDFLFVYTCSIAGAVALLYATFAALRVARLLVPKVRNFINTHLRFRVAIRRRRHVAPLTRLQLLAALVAAACAIVGNTVMLGAGSQSAGQRAGQICVVFLVPLFISLHFSAAADLMGVTLRTIAFAHALLGSIALLEAVVHVALSAPLFTFSSHTGVFGALAGVGLCVVAVVPGFRRAAYELFYLIHISISVVVLVSVWQHLPASAQVSLWTLVGAAGLLTSTTLTRALFIIYRQIRSSPRISWNRDQTSQEGAPETYTIVLRRPFKYWPGQHVIVRIFDPRNIWQSHPFIIVAGAESTLPLQQELTLVVLPQLGLTSRLRSMVGDSSLSCILDGPYGSHTDIGAFETVLMLTTGMGIFAQIPCIQGLLDAHRAASSHTRRLTVVWETDFNCGLWAKPYLDNFLQQDFEAVACLHDKKHAGAEFLRIIAFFPDKKESNLDPNTDRNTSRMIQRAGPLDVDRVLQNEFESRQGRLLVSVSAVAEVRDKVRKILSLSGKKDVELIEPDYQPNRTGSRTNRRSGTGV